MIVPQSKSQKCSIISSIKLAHVRSSQPIFRSSPPKYKCLKLSDKENFCRKILLKRIFQFDHDNWYVNNMERPFFPTKIEACREFACVGFISKHHYNPQIIQFDVSDDPRWQANIEAKQGRFQLDRYRLSLSNTEAWSKIQGIKIGFQMPPIIPGLTVPEKP